MPNPAALLALVGAGVGALLLTSKKAPAKTGGSGVQYPGAAGALNAAAASASSSPVTASPPPAIPIPTSTAPAPVTAPVISAAPAPPAPPPLVPTPVAIPPAPDPTLQIPAPGPDGSIVTTAPDGGVTTTLAPITIDGPTAAPAAAPAASTVPAWGSTPLPNVLEIPIPGSYMTPGSPETIAVQNALNTWAPEVGYTGAEIPLTVDGTYGRNTQQAAASFQAWVNATGQGSLTIDGLAGSQTQAHLADFAPMSAGGY